MHFAGSMSLRKSYRCGLRNGTGKTHQKSWHMQSQHDAHPKSRRKIAPLKMLYYAAYGSALLPQTKWVYHLLTIVTNNSMFSVVQSNRGSGSRRSSEHGMQMVSFDDVNSYTATNHNPFVDEIDEIIQSAVFRSVILVNLQCHCSKTWFVIIEAGFFQKLRK